MLITSSGETLLNSSGPNQGPNLRSASDLDLVISLPLRFIFFIYLYNEIMVYVLTEL